MPQSTPASTASKPNTLLKPKQPMTYGNASTWIRCILVLLLLLTGIAIVFQVHAYRNSFTQSQSLRAERKRLNTEWHKLLIEQQTFGATTQIGGRAVVSMGMYSPKHRDIIALNITKPKARSPRPETLDTNTQKNDSLSSWITPAIPEK